VLGCVLFFECLCFLVFVVVVLLSFGIEELPESVEAGGACVSGVVGCDGGIGSVGVAGAVGVVGSVGGVGAVGVFGGGAWSCVAAGAVAGSCARMAAPGESIASSARWVASVRLRFMCPPSRSTCYWLRRMWKHGPEFHEMYWKYK
jgi:hypothetical protein